MPRSAEGEGGRIAVRVAPRFHDPVGIAARLSRSSGADADATTFAARGPLVAPDDAEIDPGASAHENDAAIGETEVALFLLPRHLVARWWALADAAPDEGPLPGFDAFAQAVLELFRFKALPLPEPARCEAIAIACGHRAGTSPVADAAAHGAAGPRLLANLGPRAAHVVLLPVADQQIARGLRYLRDAPETALLRVRLDPGDGLWLPATDLLLDFEGEDADEAIVVLCLRPA
jgi:hypothetical protein